MDKISWLYHKRYELSGDGVGLLKYLSPKTFYHIHSKEMDRKEKMIHRVLRRLRGVVRYY